LDEATTYDLDGTVIFGVAFIIASSPLLLQYIFATIVELSGKGILHLSNKPRQITYHPLCMTIALIVSLIPWIYASATESPYAVYYWFGSLIFMEVAVMIIDMYQFLQAPICVEHWGERLALFVMLHLGESIFAMISDFTGIQSPKPYIATAFALVIAFSWRRVYFEIEGKEPKDPHAIRRHRSTRVTWTLSHWILCMSIIIFAGGTHGLLDGVINDLQSHELTDQLGNLTALDRAGKLSWDQVNSETLSEKRAEGLETVNVTDTTESNSTLISEYLLFRQSQNLFCGGLAVMVGVVFFQTLLSIHGTHEIPYRLKYSQELRLGTRAIVVIILACLPSISMDTLTIDAFETICIVGCIFFGWAVIESFFVIRKVEHYEPPPVIKDDDYGKVELDES